MFEDLIRKMRKLDGMEISVPILSDEEGFLDRECPATNCCFQFKVLEDDWDTISKADSVFCPQCRHEAKEDAWFTQSQIKEAEKQIERYVHGEIDHALKQGARKFNHKQSRHRNAFISLSVTVSGTSPRHRVVPVSSREKIEQKIICEHCNTTVAIVGSAFFCPKCGHSSVERIFDESIQKIRDRLSFAQSIRKKPQMIGSKDEVENIAIDLIESSISNAVTSFQHFSEVIYEKITGSPSPFNAFQNLSRGSELWNSCLRETYTDWLSALEYEELNKLLQQRHLLAHRKGIVDQKYIERSGDTSYVVGQKIVIKIADVQRLVLLVEKIVTELRSKYSN